MSPFLTNWWTIRNWCYMIAADSATIMLFCTTRSSGSSLKTTMPYVLRITMYQTYWLFGVQPIVIFLHTHNVESPSMVDPQWNIWYWGSKWNLHTVCWSALGCEWGTTSVYFGITYVCFIPGRLPVFAVEPQYFNIFLFLSKVSF